MVLIGLRIVILHQLGLRNLGERYFLLSLFFFFSGGGGGGPPLARATFHLCLCPGHEVDSLLGFPPVF